jgi:hypothetical protein
MLFLRFFLTYQARSFWRTKLWAGFFTYHGFLTITTSSRIISRDMWSFEPVVVPWMICVDITWLPYFDLAHLNNLLFIPKLVCVNLDSCELLLFSHPNQCWRTIDLLGCHVEVLERHVARQTCGDWMHWTDLVLDLIFSELILFIWIVACITMVFWWYACSYCQYNDADVLVLVSIITLWRPQIFY